MLNLQQLFRAPIRLAMAKLYPVKYAQSIGVNINGKVTIYGSSYNMFSTEPYLVTLYDNVFISVGATFLCHDGGVLPFRRQFPDLDLAAPIIVRENCFIGAGAVIMKGVTIGRNCIVGAHAVVTKDVPDGHIVAGNPAQIIRKTDDFIARALDKSLKIGHLSGNEKDKMYRKIFKINNKD
jgi:acetyltransferase-like isoleucine patch superfamily enzyme